MWKEINSIKFHICEMQNLFKCVCLGFVVAFSNDIWFSWLLRLFGDVITDCTSNNNWIDDKWEFFCMWFFRNLLCNGFCWHEEISPEINFEHFHLNLNENSVSLENMKKYEANNAYKYETPWVSKLHDFPKSKSNFRTIK